MKNVFAFLIISSFLILGCSDVKTKQALPSEEIELYKNIYSRNIPAIKQALFQPKPHLKLIAAKAAASIKDTALLSPLRMMLEESNMELKASAVFALGQFGSPDDLASLEIIARNDSMLPISNLALVACSKIYNEKIDEEYSLQANASVPSYINLLLEKRNDDDSFFQSYAEAIFNLNRKKIHYPQFINRMRYMLLKCSPETRVSIAQAIAGYPEYDLKEHQEYLINWLSVERNQDVKTFIIQAIGKIASSKIQSELKAIAQTVSLNTKPRMAALLALEKNNSLDKNTATTLANDSDEKIARKTLQIAIDKNIKLDIVALKKLDKSSPYIRGAWYGYKIKNGLDQDGTQCLADMMSQEDDIQKTFFIEALAYSSKRSDDLLQLCIGDKSPIVKYAAANAMVFQVNEAKWAGSFSWIQAAQSAMQTHDSGVIDAFLSLGESDKINAADKKQLLDIALLEKDKLTLPRDIEVYNHIIDFKNLFSEKKEEHIKASSRYPVSWESFHPKAATIKLETSKGIITLQLLPEIAPFSCEMFCNLIAQGFYDGKLFHRVVPNFVVQGGCPTGTGMGSLDQPIISEFSSTPYKKGTLGLASSGNDTESCQFFITHQNTPHLNGRYTVFGEVIDGWDVLDALIVGDKIIKCSLEK